MLACKAVPPPRHTVYRFLQSYGLTIFLEFCMWWILVVFSAQIFHSGNHFRTFWEALGLPKIAKNHRKSFLDAFICQDAPKSLQTCPNPPISRHVFGEVRRAFALVVAVRGCTAPRLRQPDLSKWFLLASKKSCLQFCTIWASTVKVYPPS